MFINYGLGGAGNFSAWPAQKFLTPPRQALKNFRPPSRGVKKIYDPPLSIHVNVLYMSLTNDNCDSCLCLIYEFDKWKIHWSTWIYTKTYKASRCKFYDWREARKKWLNWWIGFISAASKNLKTHSIHIQCYSSTNRVILTHETVKIYVDSW